MNEIARLNVNRQPLKRGVEHAGLPETKERLTKTLSELVSFQTIADGQHADEFRGLFDYIGEKVARAEEQTGRKFVRQEWNNNGHVSTIITPSDPSRPDEESLLHPKIAMLIHADVVNAENEDMFTLQQEGDELKGRGTLDMKSGLAIGLDLLHELPLGAALVITSDEEIGGAHGAQFLAQEVGLRPDCLIVLDGQRPEHISYGSKGVWHSEITFASLLNKGGHGSRYEDYSANELAMDLRNSLRVIYPWRYGHLPSGTTFNIGTIHGGVATNKLSQETIVKVDMRFSAEEEREIAKTNVANALQHIATERLHEVYGDATPIGVTISQREDGAFVCDAVNNETGETYSLATVKTIVEIPVYAIDTNDTYVRRFREILEEVTGQEAKINDKDMGAHDGSNWPDVPAIVYLPNGGGPHMSSEWVSAESVVQTREAIGQLLQEELAA